MVRAVVPSSVHVMAQTATATRSSRDKFFESLRMVKQASTVSMSPYKKEQTCTQCILEVCLQH